MKRQVLIGLFFILAVQFGCRKPPDHSVRILNSYPTVLYLIKIGSLDFGTVKTSEFTGYKSLDEGTHSLSGYTGSGDQISGSVTVSGRGSHEWTLEVTATGGVDMKEDR